MKTSRLILIVLLAGFVAACTGSGGTTVDDGMNDGSTASGESGGATASGVDSATLGEGGEFSEDMGMDMGMGDHSAHLDNRIVYFEFDQSEVTAAYAEMLEVHAGHLVNNPSMRVRLEGHADETGSREYNIGLGERRAQAVKRIMMLQGVGADQLSTVSYGEERPAADGSDEQSWALNRRVELVPGR